MTPPEAAAFPEHEPSVHQGTPDANGRRITPWSWIGTVNFAQGLQYAIVNQLFLIIFSSMGIPTGMAVFWAAMLGWPWVLKPLWSPLVERYWTKRNWTIWMQFVIFVCLVGCAVSFLLPSGFSAALSHLTHTDYPPFFIMSVFFLIILGFAASTHDIACDGYYMLSLTEKQQSYFVGIRSTAFRIALIVANGLLVAVAFMVVQSTGPKPPELTIKALAVVAPAETDEAPEEAKPLPVAEPQPFNYEGEPTDQVQLRLSSTTLTQDASTTGSVMLHITRPPKEGYSEVVIMQAKPSKNILRRLFLSSDTKGFSLVQERFEFTTENWREGQEVVFNFPKKISEDVELIYRATAGDLAKGWALALGICALIYALFFLYHRVIMPYPTGDGGTPTNVPFVVPLLSIFVTIAIPLAGIVVYLWLFGYLREPLQQITVGEKPIGVYKKGFDFAFTSVSYLILLGAVYLKWQIEPIRNSILDFFKTMSRKSEIGFYDVFESFFSKPGIFITLGFLLTFRLGEAQLSFLKTPFLLNDVSTGALGLGLDKFAITNTVYYLGALTAGGVLSGLVISRFGLKKMIWVCVAGMDLPNLLYVLLAAVQPTGVAMINTVVAIEAFGYGFGFAAYLLIMIMAAQGPYKTAHYALCTGFMALGMMIPGLWSGFLQELTGYYVFFWLVMLFCIPGVLFIPYLKIDEEFGKKSK